MTETAKLSDPRSIPNKQRAPMSKDQTQALVSCSFLDQSYGPDITIEKFSEQGQGKALPFALDLMVRRMAAFAPGIMVREGPILFLGAIARSPGEAVMWCFYLVRRARDLGRAVRVMDFAEDFPWGIPTEDGMRELWDMQKGAPGSGIDNRIDQPGEWSPEPETLHDPITGCGIFSWPGAERRSDRYGVIGICNQNYEGSAHVPDAGWAAPISALHGRRCKIMVRVIETRMSWHIGDLTRGIFPSTPEVGAVFDLGVGELFVEATEGFDHETVGLKPDDDRRSDWFDPLVLYRLHDQTVEITIEHVAGGAERPEPQPTSADDLRTFSIEVQTHDEGDDRTSVQMKTRKL